VADRHREPPSISNDNVSYQYGERKNDVARSERNNVRCWWRARSLATEERPQRAGVILECGFHRLRANVDQVPHRLRGCTLRKSDKACVNGNADVRDNGVVPTITRPELVVVVTRSAAYTWRLCMCVCVCVRTCVCVWCIGGLSRCVGRDIYRERERVKKDERASEGVAGEQERDR
jgi:hypothetical protein